jgi:hypothetical protein
MRKHLAAFALVAILAAALAGCTSSNPEDQTKDGVAAAT